MADTENTQPSASGEDAPRKRFDWGRPVRRLLLGVVIFLGLIAIAVGVLDSAIGHRWVANQIGAMEPESGLRIKIGRIDGSLFSEMTVHDLTLSDPQGRFVTVPETELDWRPFNWFKSGLDIRSLALRRGTLERFPQLNPGDPDAPILPDFDISIARLEVDRLRLAEGVIGEERLINLQASADIASGRAVVDARAQLGGKDRMVLALDARPDDDVFDVDLDYFAPRGGVLAGLAGTQGDVEAIITGDGNWEEWDGALLVRQDGERLAALKLSNRGGTYSALGQVAPNGYLAGTAADALGETVSLSASGTLADNVIDGRLAIAGRALKANGAGGIDLGNNRLQAFGIKARLTDPDLFGPDLRLENTRLTAELDGPFSEIRARHVLELDRLVSGAIILDRVAQRGTLTYGENGLVLPLSATVGRVTSGVELIDPRLVQGTVNGVLRLAANRLTSDELQISFPGLGANLALTGDIERGGYGLAGPVTVRRFAVQDMGSVDGQAKIVARFGANSPWLVRANFAGGMPVVTNGTLTTIAGDNIRFRGAMAVGGNQPLIFNKTELEASKLFLAVDGRVNDGSTTLAGNGRHVDYGPFTVEAEIAADGPSAQLVFADPLPAAGLKDVRVALAPIADGFGIDTSGQSTLGPFDGNLRLFAQPEQPVRIMVDRLNVYRTDVTGQLTLVDGTAAGNLALTGGGLDGVIEMAPRGGGQGFSVNLAADNAAFGGQTPLAIADGNLQASGLLVSGSTTVNGSLTARGVRYGSIFLGRVAAQAGLSEGRGEFSATLAGRRGSRFQLQLQGDVAPARAAIVAQGEYAGRRISMPRRAVFVRREDNGWLLRPTQISFADGKLLAEGRFGGEDPTSGRLQMDKMPLSLTDIVMGDMGFGGSISGIVRFGADDAGRPTGNARVMVEKFSRAGLTLTSRPLDLALVAELGSDQFQARAVLDEGGERRGRVQARISNLPVDGGVVDRLFAGRLFGQLRYEGAADALWRLSRVEAFDVTGTLALAADASGSLANPRIRGTMSGDSLRVQSGLTGTDISDVAIRGRFDGSRLELTRLTGTAANGGKVTGSGTVDLSGLGDGLPRTDIRLAARNALLMNRTDMKATVTGPLRIITNQRFGTIAGRLTIENADWRLGGATAGSQLPNIRTREINLPPDIAPPDLAGQPWRYMIDAVADDHVQVEGLGLDSEWRANIRLRGTTDDPRLGGEANLVDGDYRFAGTAFELVRGRIVFNQDLPIDPQLNILAEAEASGMTASVAVRGTAFQPEITLSSIPALPEEEILARLLYGGSITTLSATDALQLGAALASLRGGGGLDPINKLRNAIGLDRLRIVAPDPALDRGTSLALGKNITDRLYGEVITDGANYSATELEFRVTSWLSLLATVSTVGRQSVGVRYRRDY